MEGSGDQGDAAVAARQRVMRICAEATEEELERAVTASQRLPEVIDLRVPEQGLVMLRGRIGGGGRAFNVGEATVTRAAVALPNGINGFAYLLGRCPRRARLAAIVDALAQDAQGSSQLEHTLVAQVEARRAAERKRTQEETAATRVDFFTLVRGED